MKTILYILGGLFLLSKLRGNQGLSVNVTASPAGGEIPYGGAAGTIIPVGDDPYSNLYAFGGEGGVGPGLTGVVPGGGGSSGSGGGSSSSGSGGTIKIRDHFVPISGNRLNPIRTRGVTL